MEETAGAPSSFAALSPRRLRASSRDGGGVVNRPPSPLTMLLSRHTRRREVIAGLGGAWPLAARAQQPPVPIVGFLDSGSPTNRAPSVTSFRQGLDEAGYAEGRNVAMEFRWAENRYDRLPALALDLARREVAVIY